MTNKDLAIVQVVNTLAIEDGGPARNSFELNLALNQKDRVTAHLLWMRGRESESVLASHDTTRFPLPIPGPRKIGSSRDAGSSRYASLPQCLALLKNADVVVLHGYYLWWIPLMAVFLTLLRVPYVITPHGSLTTRQMSIGSKKKRYYESTIGWIVRRRMATFVTGSAIEASEISQQFSGCDALVGGVGTSLPEKFKSNDAVGDPIRLLCLSRIAPKKRIDLCIDAVAELVALRTRVKLNVAGHGNRELLEELRELARTRNVLDSVEFVGQVQGQAKSQALLDADVFLLPSDDENFGIGLAEALAHGLPCIASANVASASALQGRAGVVLSKPTGRSIALAVKELTRGPVGQSQRDARTSAEASFSWEAVSDQWVSVLLSVKK